jgi:hypothetical protein
MVATSVSRGEVEQVLLREMRGRRRALAFALVAAVAMSAGLTPSAGAANATRHYEKVSPADKGQGDIVGDGITTVAARAGDAVAYSSRSLFADVVGSGASGQTQYIGRRSADGSWSTHAITPRPRPDALQTLFAGTRLQTYSDDLRTAVVWAYDLPDVSGDTPNRNNVYVEDTATRGLQPITTLQANPLFFLYFFTTALWGVSADAQHVAVVTPTALLPDAAPGVPNVYQWDNGVLSLAGILPDGSIPATGSDVVPIDYRGAMSADGSRLAFTASEGGPPQLYLRIDGSRTVRVSQPEIGDPRDQAEAVSLEAMTPDGKNVLFVTDSRLTSDDGNTGPDLYRFRDSADPVNDPGNLTMITHDGDVPANVSGNSVVGMSDDGERVYYQPVSSRLSVWDHGTTRIIADPIDRIPAVRQQLTVTASQPGLGRVTPDGNYMAFATDRTLGRDQVHALTGEVTNGHLEIYLYSLRDGSLRCLSCPQGRDATFDVSVTAGATNGSPTIWNEAGRPRFLSDRGQVFFSTAEALVPEDRNGVADTYEYDPDSGLSLLSLGTGRNPTTFADASASGDDVFLVTRQRLASEDHDDLVDLYDARVGPAGLAAPVTDTPPCDGDACQPPQSSTPAEAVLGSLSLDGGGTAHRREAALSALKRAVFHGPAGRLKVRLAAAGTLRWSGKGLQAGSVRRSRSGAAVLRLRLGGHARAALARSGRYVTAVRLAFVARDGSRGSARTRLIFLLSTGRRG